MPAARVRQAGVAALDGAAVNCVVCGHDPDAIVTARWSFVVDMQIESLNAHRVNAGARWIQAAYRKRRDAWQWEFRVARLRDGIPLAKARRRVTITRCYSGKQRELDRDNAVGGSKSCLDALRNEGLILDDKQADVEVIYQQVRMAQSRTMITIEELAA